MTPFEQRWDMYLESLKKADRYRTLTPVRPLGGALIERAGRTLIDFSSNNYLGLAGHPALIDRATAWTRAWGAGAGASRLVTGTFEIHAAVEQKLAALKRTDAALIFNSGYQANSSVLPALFDADILGEAPLVFTDKLVHASLHHGCRAAGVREIRFRHNDLGHLDSLLKKHQGKAGARFILTESVFSMDGDRADLAALSDIAERYGAFLYVDEAHATGVLGPNGMGLSGDVPGKVDLIMGTFSKALGSFGAYVACSKRLKEMLVNRCGGLIYATALPPGVLGAMDAALDLVPTLDTERARLQAAAKRLRTALRDQGLDTGGSTTQIVPAVIGSEKAALAAARVLEDAGILGIAIRPPTVPSGASRIRLAVTAAHTDAQMNALCAAVPALAAVKAKR
ncbi:MAG: 8-amino-7-oxononanoate synthase [Rhodospirillales bacterium]